MHLIVALFAENMNGSGTRFQEEKVVFDRKYNFFETRGSTKVGKVETIFFERKFTRLSETISATYSREKKKIVTISRSSIVEKIFSLIIEGGLIEIGQELTKAIIKLIQTKL